MVSWEMTLSDIMTDTLKKAAAEAREAAWAAEDAREHAREDATRFASAVARETRADTDTVADIFAAVFSLAHKGDAAGLEGIKLAKSRGAQDFTLVKSGEPAPAGAETIGLLDVAKDALQCLHKARLRNAAQGMYHDFTDPTRVANLDPDRRKAVRARLKKEAETEAAAEEVIRNSPAWTAREIGDHLRRFAPSIGEAAIAELEKGILSGAAIGDLYLQKIEKKHPSGEKVSVTTLHTFAGEDLPPGSVTCTVHDLAKHLRLRDRNFIQAGSAVDNACTVAWERGNHPLGWAERPSESAEGEGNLDAASAAAL